MTTDEKKWPNKWVTGSKRAAELFKAKQAEFGKVVEITEEKDPDWEGDFLYTCKVVKGSKKK